MRQFFKDLMYIFGAFEPVDRNSYGYRAGVVSRKEGHPFRGRPFALAEMRKYRDWERGYRGE